MEYRLLHVYYSSKRAVNKKEREHVTGDKSRNLTCHGPEKKSTVSKYPAETYIPRGVTTPSNSFPSREQNTGHSTTYSTKRERPYHEQPKFVSPARSFSFSDQSAASFYPTRHVRRTYADRYSGDGTPNRIVHRNSAHALRPRFAPREYQHYDKHIKLAHESNARLPYHSPDKVYLDQTHTPSIEQSESISSLPPCPLSPWTGDVDIEQMNTALLDFDSCWKSPTAAECFAILVPIGIG